MKKLHMIAIAAALVSTSGVASARWVPGNSSQHHETQRRGWDARDHDDHGHRRMNLEAKVQLRLKRLGYFHGNVDGTFGRQSRHALRHFQHDHRLAKTGEFDRRTLRALGL